MTADLASVRIGAPADTVYEFVSDPARLNMWSVGTWKTVLHADGLIEGWAMGNGAHIWVRFDPCPGRLMVDYLIGSDPQQLQPRIFTRVVPGDVAGIGPDSCLLLMGAIRTAGMEEARWTSLKTTHAFEVGLVKTLVESGHDHRTMQTG